MWTADFACVSCPDQVKNKHRPDVKLLNIKTSHTNKKKRFELKIYLLFYLKSIATICFENPKTFCIKNEHSNKATVATSKML